MQKSKFIEQNRQALIQFLIPLVIVDFDASAANVYGLIRVMLEQVTPIGSLDTLINNNVKKFNCVPGLKLENWLD